MAQRTWENEAGQIELLPYHPVVLVREVLRRWYVIAAAAILAGMAAFVLTELQYSPNYTTTTTFVVSKQGNSTTVFENLSATTSLASVFSEVLNSSILRQNILEKLEMPAFYGTIHAEAIAETNLLTLRVTDRNPRTAFLVTRVILENHQLVTSKVMGDTILEVLQQPVVPTAPSNPLNAKGAMKKAAVLAAAAVTGLLFLIAFLRDTVRSKREAERKLDSPILCELYHERKRKTLVMWLKRKKRSILITNPSTSFSYVERIRKLRRQVEQRMPQGGKVLMVASVLENEGKSTVAANLALSLAQKHANVLLLEGDLRRPACYKVLSEPWNGPGVAAVLRGEASLSESVVCEKRLGNLCLLLETKEQRHTTDLIGSKGMEALLREARTKFSYVIVDTPPMAAAADAEALAELADASLLVVRQNAASAPMLNHGLEVLQTANSKLLGCILNNVYASALPHANSYGYGYGYGYGGYGKYGHYGAYGAYQNKRSPAGRGEETDEK